jgi:hypothetical protein
MNRPALCVAFGFHIGLAIGGILPAFVEHPEFLWTVTAPNLLFATFHWINLR